jgi:hypothetical protein
MGDEIKAMSAINDAMEGLEEEEARRVLSWAVDKFGGGEPVTRSALGNRAGAGNGQRHDANPAGYQRISDLMDAASPDSIVEWVLVGTYWHQIVRGDESVTGQQVNTDLKDLGHGSKNITDSYNSLISRKPPLVRQVEKSGRSKQARKKYRLTNEGIRAVERMLSGEAAEE